MLHVPTLRQKLSKIGIQGQMLSWITEFLTNRSFQVKVDTEWSSKFVQENGIPQGSITSPRLFLIMINDKKPTGYVDNVERTLFA